MKHKFDVQNLFADFEYPRAFLKIIQLGFVDFDWWYLMNTTQVYKRRKGLSIRYPNRNLIPFARRSDCDTIACFEVGAGEKVFIIHDFSSSGFEQENEFENFKSWFLDVIAEMLEDEN